MAVYGDYFISSHVKQGVCEKEMTAQRKTESETVASVIGQYYRYHTVIGWCRLRLQMYRYQYTVEFRLITAKCEKERNNYTAKLRKLRPKKKNAHIHHETR